jgi:hypothetical protein
MKQRRRRHESTAYHEAGHAVAAFVLRLKIGRRGVPQNASGLNVFHTAGPRVESGHGRHSNYFVPARRNAAGIYSRKVCVQRWNACVPCQGNRIAAG